MGSHQFKLHNWTALKWQDAHYWWAARLTKITVLFFFRLGWCIFLEPVHITFKTSGFWLFTSNFSVVSLYITWFFFVLLLMQQAPQPLQCSLKIWIDTVTRKLLGSSFCSKNESACEGCSRTLFANSVHEDCSYIKKRLKPLTQHCAHSLPSPVATFVLAILNHATVNGMVLLH